MTKDEIIREEVILAAKGLFQRYGIHKTTMEDIAKAAGKGKSTLYYYFKNKDQIFDEVLSGATQETFEKVKQAVEEAESTVDKIKAYTIVKLKRIHEQSILYNVLFGEIGNDLNIIRKFKKRYSKQEHDLLVSIFEYGISRNEIREFKEVSLDDMAFVMNRANWGIEMSFLEDEDMGSMIEKYESVMEVFMYGILKS